MMWQHPQTICDLLKRNAAELPGREAFVSISYQGGDIIRHTWKEIDEISSKLAVGLHSIGIAKGQKVAFLLTNSAECYYTYLAIHKLGAVFVPINVRLVSREVEHIIENADADFIIAGREFLGLTEGIRSGLSSGRIVGIQKQEDKLPDWAVPYSDLMAVKGTLPEVDISINDTADILYTSGTTGLPKGVVLTQGNKLACGKLIGTSVGLSRLHYGEPVLQTVYPFFTSSGCSSVIMLWLQFAPKLILDDVFDVSKTLETISREKSTIYAGAPAMFVFLLSHPGFKDFDTSSITTLISGAAAMPEEVIRNIQDAWTDVKIYNIYALTEGGTGGTTLDSSDLIRKLGSVGHPWSPDQELRIVNEHGRDMPQGEVGEIILRGPNVMKEYYKNPEATAETLKNGWLHTGDMGYVDAEGYLYFTDRLKDMIIRGGFNIYSLEVENVLYEHPAVNQCAVVGKPHEQLGEDIVAFVVLNKGYELTPEDLNKFTHDKLADYKRPRDIRFVDALPINPTGKLDKKVLRADFV